MKYQVNKKTKNDFFLQKAAKRPIINIYTLNECHLESGVVTQTFQKRACLALSKFCFDGGILYSAGIRQR